MRLRLLIPAALAAAATYLALVRDEGARPAALPPLPPPAPPLPEPVQAADSPAGEQAEPDAALAGPEPATLAPPAPSIFEDLASAESRPGAPTILDLLAGGPPAGSAARDLAATPPGPEAPTAERPDTGGFTDQAWQAPMEEGRFALGGWAAAAGHSVVSAVTFRRRLPTEATAERIALEIDASDNIPEGGLVVLSDPGFAPDREGFTLLLAAAAPGPFSAAGSYRVLPSR